MTHCKLRGQLFISGRALRLHSRYGRWPTADIATCPTLTIDYPSQKTGQQWVFRAACPYLRIRDIRSLSLTCIDIRDMCFPFLFHSIVVSASERRDRSGSATFAIRHANIVRSLTLLEDPDNYHVLDTTISSIFLYVDRGWFPLLARCTVRGHLFQRWELKILTRLTSISLIDCISFDPIDSMEVQRKSGLFRNANEVEVRWTDREFRLLDRTHLLRRALATHPSLNPLKLKSLK